MTMPQRLIFSRFSVIVDSFSRCGIVVYSSFFSSVVALQSVVPLMQPLLAMEMVDLVMLSKRNQLTKVPTKE
jgi:hypothetical protein